ncbi:MAG: SDR family NAD(P)-dependent oxidoreductase, partial [bacterium]|nr:SDR family NAD(P)-dependent oxidoreductase [bacterium]
PNIQCRSIDIVVPESGSAREKLLLVQLEKELYTDSPGPVTAYRNNHRLVPDYGPVRLEKPEPGSVWLKEKGVYLITGGLGGIGLVLAGHLAKKVKAKLILTGRSVFPARETWEQWLASHQSLEHQDTAGKIRKLQELEQMGAETAVFSADIADYRRMRQVIAGAEERFGPINGVIHAAGVPGDGLIRLKSKEMAENVLSPKIKGTMVLDSLFSS